MSVHCLMLSDYVNNSAFLDDLTLAVIPCDVVKSCHLPMLITDEERFLSAYEIFDLAPYIVIGFVPKVLANRTINTGASVTTGGKTPGGSV